MKISELKDKTPVEEIVVKVTDISEPRDTRVGPVQDATIEDDSGSATLTLWTEDVGKYGIGDMVKVTNGWAKMYQGNLQVSSGKFGTLEKVEE